MAAFEQLAPGIQRWIWSEGWSGLRDAQEQAVAALIEADRDVIIAAQTAAGKTEAAFLPILSHLLRTPEDLGCVIYISPIKALINDQFGRLTGLCAGLDIPVVPWHGDISQSKKQQFLKRPSGVVLITPESLEALFVNRGASIRAIMGRLTYLVVDELHSFIGTERGMQLQSLMHRCELAAGVPVRRVGLSATLGDMTIAAQFLRPAALAPVEMIVSTSTEQNILVLIKGYIESDHDQDGNTPEGPTECQIAIADHLYAAMRDSNNLIFPNAKRSVEIYADLLRQRCEENGIANRFWPHHGSLSKELREDAERSLKDGRVPATAVCTNTLELGVDIGAIKCIAQIDPPPSVASLRQRLGRSGRRNGEPSILRCYSIEDRITPKSYLSTRLREGLVHSIAAVNLLLKGDYEPPCPQALHSSTMVQQILSLIAERGGVSASAIWHCLIANGPFTAITKSDFVDLLRAMGETDLIVQESSGILLHGKVGERLVANYEFYAAFASDDEYSIVNDGKVLGAMPIHSPMVLGQSLIFAGRRWRVTLVDDVALRVLVVADRGGAPPLFTPSRGLTHDIVRAEMRRVLNSDEPYRFMDANAAGMLAEVRDFAASTKLLSRSIGVYAGQLVILTWRGDAINNTLVMMLARHGIESGNNGVAVEIYGDETRLYVALRKIQAEVNIDVESLLSLAKNIAVQKWDWTLPRGLLSRSYASSQLDIAGTQNFVAQLLQDDSAVPQDQSTQVKAF